MIRYMTTYLVLLLMFSAGHAEQADLLFTIARLQYKGGGDWYSDPSALPNLLRFLKQHTSIDVATEESRVQIMDEELFSYPYIYMTGHDNISFSPEEDLPDGLPKIHQHDGKRPRPWILTSKRSWKSSPRLVPIPGFWRPTAKTW